jgi:shikimate kinase
MTKKNNIILIGMPGAGKSIIGKELAKRLAMEFLDVDEYIERMENKRLQEIINEVGDNGFVEIEKKRVLELNLSNHVISTGGSVVLKEETMEHLRKLGILVFLDISLEILKERLTNLDTRGVVGIKSGKTIEEIFDFRQPLYRKYADLTINFLREITLDKTVDEIIMILKNRKFV